MIRRLIRLATVLMVLATPLLIVGSGAAVATASSPSKPQLLALRGRLGGGLLGHRSSGGGLFSRHRSAFGTRRNSRGLLHRIARALAFAYLLHLFFAHGGISILLWIIIIGVVVHLLRRRRRRYAY
jgi:hypothetical protein